MMTLDFTFYKVNPGMKVGWFSFGMDRLLEVVQDSNFVAVFYEGVRRVRADETCAACYQDIQSSSPICWNMICRQI